jgi:3-hydroxy-9,10-secoandrosta-1,3,5(10)-triene-9,17-dione monooxygenase
MAATGSVSIAATSVFVPEECGLPFSTVTSAADHPGAVHEEEVYRFPFSALTLATVSLYVGALDAAVELAREGLQKSSGPPGPKRIERAAMRTRWINAYEAARVVRLVRDAAAHEALEIARRGTAPTMEEEAREQLHIQFIRQTVKNTLRDLVDSNGTSTHKADNQLRRASGDIAMLSTHALNGEYDVAMDRNARWLLGLGLSAGDPGARLT